MLLDRRQLLLGAAAAMVPALGRAEAALPEMMKIIVPFPPGNTLDGSARWFGAAYQTVTGRTAVVENPEPTKTTAAAELRVTSGASYRPARTVVSVMAP